MNSQKGWLIFLKVQALPDMIAVQRNANFLGHSQPLLIVLLNGSSFQLLAMLHVSNVKMNVNLQPQVQACNLSESGWWHEKWGPVEMFRHIVYHRLDRLCCFWNVCNTWTMYEKWWARFVHRRSKHAWHPAEKSLALFGKRTTIAMGIVVFRGFLQSTFTTSDWPLLRGRRKEGKGGCHTSGRRVLLCPKGGWRAEPHLV